MFSEDGKNSNGPSRDLHHNRQWEAHLKVHYMFHEEDLSLTINS